MKIKAFRCAILFPLIAAICQTAFAEKHAISIETDTLVGKVYNLWDVRVLNSPERWLKKGYAEDIQSSSHHINVIMNVRLLGGKINRTCEWFKGVDAEGEPICDFTGLYAIINAQIGAGFEPWVVLDQVPHAMTSAKPNDIYGIVNPADDMKLWYKYVRKTVAALVGKDGRKIDAVLEANKEKYAKLSELKQIRSAEEISLKDGELKLQVQLRGSGFHFLKLTMPE